MTNCNYSEHAKIQRKEIQKQIEELQTALKLLEIEENRRTTCEKAYRDAYGYFPITDSMSGGDNDYIAWDAFQKGWEASKKYHNKYFVIANSKQEETEKLQEKEKVMENLKTSLQELANGDVRPIDDVMEEVRTLQEKEWTYKFTDEKRKWNPYKQYLNGVKTFRQELFDYGFSDSTIGDIILIINRFLPEPIKETCGLSQNDVDWNNGYNTYRECLVKKLK